MRTNFKSIARSIGSFIIAAVFLYLAFRSTNPQELWQSLKSAKFFWVVLLIPIGLISNWVRAVRWAYLLAPVKSKTSVRNLFSAVMIGYMVNNVLPRVGELVRPYVLGNLEAISKSSALGTVVIERILDLITFTFVLCAVLFLYPHALDAFVSNVESIRVLFLIGSIVALVLFIILFLKSESLFSLIKIVKPVIPKRYASRVDRLIGSFLSGFAVVRMHDKLTPIVVWSLILYTVYGLSLYVAFFALEPIARLHLDFGAAMVLLTVSSVAYILPAPGALGTYHSFLTFSLIKLYGADGIASLTYSIITHEVGYITTNVVGIYYFLKDRVKLSEVSFASAETA